MGLNRRRPSRPHPPCYAGQGHPAQGDTHAHRMGLNHSYNSHNTGPARPTPAQGDAHAHRMELNHSHATYPAGQPQHKEAHLRTEWS
jgi:hypothetical protein